MAFISGFWHRNRRRVSITLLAFLTLLSLGYTFRNYPPIRLTWNRVWTEWDLFQIKMAENYGEKQAANPNDLPKIIAHGGGAYQGLVVTNSQESLDHAYRKNVRYIEVDLSWTRDSKLVCLHDWGKTLQSLFDLTPQQLSLNEFMSLRMRGHLTPLSLETLVEWLEDHPDAFVVTDVKTQNIDALQLISSRFTQYKRQFIPQIYSFSEYYPVRKMGFENIILTLYRSSYTDDQVIRFVTMCPLFGVTIYAQRAEGPLPTRLESLGQMTYVHTINETAEMQRFLERRTCGIYTDNLDRALVQK